MKIPKTIISMLMLAMGVVACNTEVTPTIGGVAESVEVGFAMPVDVTRTTIDPDGMTTRWAPGDKLAVWAKDGSGNFTFESTTFTLHHFSQSYDMAYFTANIPAMAEGDYTYMFSYPQPKSTVGTQATYNVSATQSGKYDGKYDIMLAEPVVDGSLTTGEYVKLNTTMRHQMHALKITIPEGRNLFGQRFYRLEITFPQDVVGDVMLDVSDPNEPLVYNNTSNVITVENAEGFDAGDDIWVFVLPGTINGDVSYKVRGELRPSNVATYPLTRTLEAGHVTPIRMAIPTIYPYFTAIHFSVDQNNLGEEFNYFDLYDSNGTHMGTYERNSSNKYTWFYEGEFDADQYDNTSWRVVFDSEHAIVETAVSLGDMTDYTEHTRWMNVPYLLSEDFSRTTESESYGNNDYASSEREQPGVSLDGCMPTAGWNAARYWTKGNSMRINTRYQSAVGFASTHYGRLDTPLISTLKDGAIVDVRVSFDAGSYVQTGTATVSSINLNLTTHTISTNPIDGIPTGASGAFSSYDTTTADFGTLRFTTPNLTSFGSEDFTAIFPSYSLTIPSLNNSNRICFYPSMTVSVSLGTGNAEAYVYIDNIKVQIAQ